MDIKTLQALIASLVDKFGASVKPGEPREPRELPTGQSSWFLGQRTNPAANERRHAKRLIGARQYRMQRKALARAAREIA